MPVENQILAQMVDRYPALEVCAQAVSHARKSLFKVAAEGGKILLCGNGGSCADCDHISGELLKGFLSKRPLPGEEIHQFARVEGGEELAGKLQRGICAIPLPAMTAALTAFSNDVDPEAVYAQLVLAMGKKGDALICISTSGNARNVCNAAKTAKVQGICVIGLTGENGGKLSELCDVCIRVPGTETFKIQELHLPVYHALCAALEADLFGEAV